MLHCRMLHFCSTRHNAPQRTPYREARLLGFATGNPPSPESEKAEAEAKAEKPKAKQEVVKGDIGGIEKDTHRSAEAAMERITIGSVAEKARKVHEDAEAMLKRMEDPKLSEFVHKHFTKDERKQWEDNVAFLKDNITPLRGWHELAARLKEWEEGKIPPTEFLPLLAEIDSRFAAEVVPGETIDRLKNLSPEDQQKICKAYGIASIDDIAHNVDQKGQGKMALEASEKFINETLQGKGVRNWGELNASSQIELQPTLITDLPKIADLDRFLQRMDRELDTWKGGIAQCEKYVEGVEGGVEKGVEYGEEDGDDETHGHGGKGFWASLGIQWYSLYDVMEGIKQWKEAYIEAWRHKNHLKGATIAQQLGGITKWLPFAGDDLQIILDQNVDRKNEEHKNHFKEYLQARNVSFKTLFGPGGMMEHDHVDPNHARAILEYAAGRGWLYDIEESKEASENEQKIYGYRLIDLVPNNWQQRPGAVDDYFKRLLGENASGADKETQNAKARERDTVFPGFITAIDKELDGFNFWAAIGIMQRAVERGLIGEASPWIAVRVLRKIRENPIIRRYMPIRVLDKIGEVTFYKTFYTLGMIKGERYTIYDWMQKNKKETGALAAPEKSRLGKVIGLIEGEVHQIMGQLPTQELDKIVAKVLAGQTVDLGGGRHITIFNDRYAEFRKTPKRQGTVNPSQEDEDYYVQESDILLADAGIYRQIFAYSNGHIKAESHAQKLADKIFLRYDQLSTVNPPAAENFRQEMGEKLQTFLEEALDDSRSTPLRTMMTKNPEGYEKENMLIGLLRRGFVNLDKARDIVVNKRSNVGVELARWLLEQAGQLPAQGETQRRTT